jgi:[acyl-carrier-protein] S-malonyltransferase
MQAAVPPGQGAMAAIIGLEQDVVAAVCAEAAIGGVCQIANDNGGGQLVISGSKAEVDRACELLKARGAKRAIPLPVSAPFHSALMAPAADAMREALAAVEVRRPSVPLVANVLAAPVSDPEEIRRRLVEQVTGQVRWRESIEFLAANGVTVQLELGSGKVLSGLVRRIAKEMGTLACGAPADVEGVMSAINA